ncbi:carcinoembryonic antigen-related cell adhesion molecule 1 [Sorex fumeus]|uniref:carcinoembryonic antigen-related cell adhesion molecule 1 n=1 Tax=Sorex fumeus TaxID=62283 RepID=UPI0024AD74C3|nr:carcinoembryonic antigen-related cell adhesion molecule 1 [Sorex fumeus]
MESPSAPAHRGYVPWKGLLLAAALLPFWSLPTNAFSVELIPANAVVGDSVNMLVHKMPENVLRLDWYKESVEPKNIIATLKSNPEAIVNGPLYSNRETLFNNGTLQIRNLTREDKATYLLQAITLGSDILQGKGELGVYDVHSCLTERRDANSDDGHPWRNPDITRTTFSVPHTVLLTKPTINADNESPTEMKETVKMQCDPETPDTTYRWFFNSKPVVLSDGLELSMENRILTLNPTLRNNTGAYVCENWNPVSSKTSDPFNLVVFYGPDPPVISPSKTFYRRGANLSLSCYTASHPPAKFTWITSKQAVVSAQNFFIPTLSPDDSGSYTCLVNNTVTSLSNNMTLEIIVLDPVTSANIKASNTTVQEGDNSVTLLCLTNDTEISIQWLLNNQTLQPSDTKVLSQDNRTLILKTVSVYDAGNYHCEVSNPISSLNSPTVKLEVTPKPTGLSAAATAGIVIGILVGLTMIGGVLYFMYNKKTGRLPP